MADVKKCPMHTQKASNDSNAWWPNKLNLTPLGKGVEPASASEYAKDFASLDLDALCADLKALMTESKDWWPADYGHYGPFFIRMAWHSAGTYRTFDGRGGGGRGNIRFAPLNSWPDNVNLDKARRLLWPIKKKYGKKISWADLMILTGNVALESMGFKTFGFAGGRADIWEPEEDIYWGSEKEWLAGERGGLGEGLEQPLGAVQMGLIYVNPEGPGGNPDIAKSAQDIRATFGRMAMNDEETVALIAGGHTFGKAHGAAPPAGHVGPEPEGASIEEQGLGWSNTFGSGKGEHTIGSGLEGAWTWTPTKWDNAYFDILFKYEWEKSKSPAGATLWIPKGGEAADTVPDAHNPAKRHPPIMFTTDLAVRYDPSYGAVAKRFHENPDQFAEAFAKAWYKLTHRDMGPPARCLGPLVPPPQIWQDPVPEVSGALIGNDEIAELKASVLKASSPVKLVKAAWASASTFRGTDHRGGANGARVRLAPQKDWTANNPAELAEVLKALEGVQAEFNGKGGAQVSLADLIVLGGAAGVEAASGASVPFTPGRTDATDEMTDAASFDVLEPFADGFRNYYTTKGPYGDRLTPEALIVDKARMLNLSKPEMTALVGGLRTIGANFDGSNLGVFTANPGTLSNDFFVNLLDMGTKWEKVGDVYEGKDRASGELKWKGTSVDLVFGSNSELRGVAEYYATDDAKDAFISDFVAAWTKVMNLGRYYTRIQSSL